MTLSGFWNTALGKLRGLQNPESSSYCIAQILLLLYELQLTDVSHFNW